jgi:5'(3')-deoxyribonucleotidase
MAGYVLSRHEETTGLMRTIAIDLDDTLNNFEETLQTTTFQHDVTYGFSAQVFEEYLTRLRQGAAVNEDLLSTEYSFFKYQIHQQCYQRATARADGVEFIRRLKRDGWRIVICTYRDLRRAQDCTRKWLRDNGVPFDHLFMAWNKIVFCRVWGIEYLVDDDPFNIIQGEKHGVSVFYPALDRLKELQPNRARAFHSFSEILPWITG